MKAMRSYHSNDALDDVSTDHLYEDPEACNGGNSSVGCQGQAQAPPRLAPVSGQLEQVRNVTSNKHYCCMVHLLLTSGLYKMFVHVDIDIT